MLLAAAVLIAWIAAIALLVRALRKAEKPSDSIIAALGVCVIALLHSLVDFSLQIPGLRDYCIVIDGGGTRAGAQNSGFRPKTR